MTTKISLSRQASAVSVLTGIVSGSGASKPRSSSQLEMLLADAQAAHDTLVWLDNNKDIVLDAIRGTTIGKAIIS